MNLFESILNEGAPYAYRRGQKNIWDEDGHSIDFENKKRNLLKNKSNNSAYYKIYSRLEEINDELYKVLAADYFNKSVEDVKKEHFNPVYFILESNYDDSDKRANIYTAGRSINLDDFTSAMNDEYPNIDKMRFTLKVKNTVLNRPADKGIEYFLDGLSHYALNAREITPGTFDLDYVQNDGKGGKTYTLVWDDSSNGILSVFDRVEEAIDKLGKKLRGKGVGMFPDSSNGDLGYENKEGGYYHESYNFRKNGRRLTY